MSAGGNQRLLMPLDPELLVLRVGQAIAQRAGMPPHRLTAGAIQARATRLCELFAGTLAGTPPTPLFQTLEAWAREDADAGRGPLGLQTALSVLQEAIWQPGALDLRALAHADGLLHQARQAVADNVARQLGYREAKAAEDESRLLQAGLELGSQSLEQVLSLRWLERTPVQRGLLALIDEHERASEKPALVVAGGYDRSGTLKPSAGERYTLDAFPPPEWAPPGDIHPTLLFAVTGEERPLGWLSLCTPFNRSEAHLYRAIASDIAAVLTKAGLYERQRRRAEQLSLITQVARHVTSVLDLDALLERVVETIRSTFLLYHVMVLLIDESGEELVMRAATGEEGRRLRAQGGLRVGVQRASAPVPGSGIAAWVAGHGRALIVADVQRDPRYRAVEALPGTRSELAMPLRIGGQVLGVIDIQSDQAAAFGPEDVAVMQVLSDQIAVALRNAQLYEAAEDARREAQEASRLKSQFLANMSHELRTPLNSIINFTRFVMEGLKGPVNDAQRDYLARVHDAARHLLGLINDVLDLSKVEAGKLDLYIEDVDLREIISGVMSTAVGLTRDKPVELRSDIAAGLPRVRGDRTRLRQVVLNLVANAAKFTERGEIAVRAWARDGQVYVSVKDTGIGMAPEEIPGAFEEFRQLEGSHARRYGGTGLGLPIAHRFVELHGGRLWAESAKGRGSTFTFAIPVERPGAPPGSLT